MTKTENYNLNQWESSDRVLMEDFNEDNRKIESALNSIEINGLKMAIGNYVGTGTYGSSNPNTLHFDFPPKLILVYYGIYGPMWLFPGETSAAIRPNASETSIETVAWGSDGKTVSWYCEHGAQKQLNTNGTKYLTIAWG